MNKQICKESGKYCYSKKEAGNMIRYFKKHRNFNKNIPKRSYFCNYCGTFHLTHLKKKSKKIKKSID